jgi:hypothetical protein
MGSRRKTFIGVSDCARQQFACGSYGRRVLRAMFGVTIKNEGLRSFDVSNIKLRVWSDVTGKQLAQ